MIKDLVKKAMYHSGGMSVLHHRRYRQALTVVLFHRVLPAGLMEELGADPDWTVTEQFFEDCLTFYKKHYNPVCLRQLQEYLEHGRPLPEYPLLVTFDDGWKDNLLYAMPIARKQGIRPLLFVTTGAIGRHMLSWQEALYIAWRGKALSVEHVCEIANLLQQSVSLPKTESQIRELIRRIQQDSEVVRGRVDQLVSKIGFPAADQMLNQEELQQLAEGFDFGTHGIRHEPLTLASRPLIELSQARDELSAMCNQSRPLSMSFPHNRLNPDLVVMAYEAGYSMVFNGDRSHALLQPGRRAVFGRHNMNQLHLQNAQGRLRPELLALELFRQPLSSMQYPAAASAGATAVSYGNA